MASGRLSLEVNRGSFYARMNIALVVPWIDGCLMVTEQKIWKIMMTKREISEMEVSLTGGCLPLLKGSSRPTRATGTDT